MAGWFGNPDAGGSDMDHHPDNDRHLCEYDAQEAVGERLGEYLCSDCWSKCSDCHEAEGTLDLLDGSRVCIDCAGERFDAQTAGAGYDNDSQESAAMREADAVYARARR